MTHCYMIIDDFYANADLLLIHSSLAHLCFNLSCTCTNVENESLLGLKKRFTLLWIPCNYFVVFNC